ncbi:MAG: pyridoxamine 5'-phosphate oxidase family protein [Candidatus Omnitrophica bacterium]|nr:pyridoxamine 5'-phosphate oxidase family protein [Candidatus Omnitrophota bacterium]MCA9407102.1 pyridoxamine 5'-phosphate oxidase family protein [Candidatus Omnitrophota bacterium]
MELDEKCKEVIEKTEWIAITTSSEEGPHTVAAWGYRLRKFGILDGGIILLPAGKYFRTEDNLKINPKIQILIASSEVQREGGTKGQGYRISGSGEIQLEGKMVSLVKKEFPWARGALVIKLEKSEALIS